MAEKWGTYSMTMRGGGAVETKGIPKIVQSNSSASSQFRAPFLAIKRRGKLEKGPEIVEGRGVDEKISPEPNYADKGLVQVVMSEKEKEHMREEKKNLLNKEQG